MQVSIGTGGGRSGVECVPEADKPGVDTVWPTQARHPAGATLERRLAALGRARDLL